jgi:hypothetical protein
VQVSTEIDDVGFSLALSGAWQSPSYHLRFPEEVWQGFLAKEALVRELAYVLTMAPPLIAGSPAVWYDRPSPQFFDIYNSCFEQAIPNLVENIPSESSDEILTRFRTTNRNFPKAGHGTKLPLPEKWHHQRIILPFSFGKDSLLSLATLTQLGFEVIPVAIDERVLPRCVALRKKLQPQLSTLGFEVREVINEIQLLSDYQVWELPETRLHQVHVHFVYLLAMLPFVFFYKAPWIVFNNELHNSLDYQHREGYLLPRMVMQSSSTLTKFKKILAAMSGGQIRLANLLAGLGDFAIHWILHDTFSEYGDLRLSCHMEMCEHERWCHDCSRCARAFLFFLAMGTDPFAHGFIESMTTKDKAHHFALSEEPIHPDDAFRAFTGAEERLALEMIRSRGERLAILDHIEPLPSKLVDQLSWQIFSLHHEGTLPIEKQAAKLFQKSLLLARNHFPCD